MTDQATEKGRAVRSMVGAVAVLLTLAIAPTAASAASLPMVSAGDEHTCAITRDGIAACWGSNKYGQTDVPAGKTWASISAGTLRSCGVTTDGDGFCWGFNGWGQGNVPADRKWKSISSQHAHSCGVTTAGDGFCWGYNGRGQGNVPEGKTWKQISAGARNSCGVMTTGAGYCWGSNDRGQNSLPGGKTWSSISTSSDFSCGVTTGGQGYCWSRGNSDKTVVPSGKTWSAITASSYNACGVTTGGEGHCWGGSDSDEGQSTVPAGHRWISISPGRIHSCGVINDGRILCWGNNRSGQTNVPVDVFTSDPAWAPPTVTGSPGARVNPRVNPVSISFTGGPGTTFECSLDGGAFAPCTSPVSSGATPEGPHRIAIRQVTSDGHTSDPTTVTWTVDTTAPAKPGLSGRPAAPTRSTGASFTFTGEAKAAFTCSLDGADYTPCTSPWNLTGLSEETHTFAVKQTDQAGNTGPAETATWTVDTTAPAKPGLSGTPASPTRSTGASLTLSGEANAKFTCSLDGGAYASCTSPRNLTGLTDGTHTLSVKQIDQAGNTGPVETVTWTVDTTPPLAPVLSSGPSGSVYASTATFGFARPGATGFTCALDGQRSSPCTSPATFESLAVGIHTFSVSAMDAVGNVSSATTRRWTVLPEQPTITSAPSGTINPTKTPATVTFTGLAGAKFQCSKDKGAWTACTSPFAFGSAVDGTHTFQVRQVVSRSAVLAFVSEAVTASWKVDTEAPPKPSLKGVPAANTTARDATIAITAEVGATLDCRIDSGAASACSTPVALTDLADGVHTLTVIATDSVGNVSAPAVATWRVDTVAPAAPTFTGKPNPITGLTTATLGFRAESGASFRCSIDGGTWAQCTSPRALSKLSTGDHSFAVKAIDAAGNVSDPATAFWTVETKAPPAAVLDAKPDQTSGSSTASFSITPPPYSTMTCSLDNAPFTACGSTRSFTGLKSGKHTFQVRVTRGAAAATTSYTWTIDLSVPAKPVWASAPSGYFGFSGTAGMTFECSIDSGAFAACSSPLKIPTLPDGEHTISIRQKSANGKVSAPLVGTWTVDVAGRTPTVTGTSVNAYQTLLLGDQRWHLKAQLVVSAGGTNANSVLSLAQVSWSVSKPAATPVPTVASDPDGVYEWQGLDVQVPAGEIVVGETIPTWIRVGTVGGQWTDWLPVTTD